MEALQSESWPPFGVAIFSLPKQSKCGARRRTPSSRSRSNRQNRVTQLTRDGTASQARVEGKRCQSLRARPYEDDRVVAVWSCRKRVPAWPAKGGPSMPSRCSHRQQRRSVGSRPEVRHCKPAHLSGQDAAPTAASPALCSRSKALAAGVPASPRSESSMEVRDLTHWDLIRVGPVHSAAAAAAAASGV